MAKNYFVPMIVATGVACTLLLPMLSTVAQFRPHQVEPSKADRDAEQAKAQLKMPTAEQFKALQDRVEKLEKQQADTTETLISLGVSKGGATGVYRESVKGGLFDIKTFTEKDMQPDYTDLVIILQTHFFMTSQHGFIYTGRVKRDKGVVTLHREVQIDPTSGKATPSVASATTGIVQRGAVKYQYIHFESQGELLIRAVP